MSTMTLQRAYHGNLQGRMHSLEGPHSHFFVVTGSHGLKKDRNRCQAVQNEHMISNRADAERLLQRVAAMVADQEELLPFDREAFNLPLSIWRQLSLVKAHDRIHFLDVLPTRDIKKLWYLSGKRYEGTQLDKMSIMGPEYNVRKEFPAEPGKVDVYQGIASLPVLNRFRKLFFVDKKARLIGHVDTGFTKPLFPLYFACSTKESLFPDTNSLTDMQLHYLPLGQLDVPPGDIPPGLPTPREPRWPFSGGLTDYMRAFGPGMFVGRGWKRPIDASARNPGHGFLYFVLVKVVD